MELTDDQLAYLNEHLDLVAEYAKLALTDQPPFVKIEVPFEVISVAILHEYTLYNMVQITLNVDPLKNGNKLIAGARLLLEYVDKHAHAYVLK